ncbi:COX15/CtaA family protein [bacterium]|nr:COX15/CtaA family protein [bacterium]
MPHTKQVRAGNNHDILALGFGTTIAMWAIGYFCRLPVIGAPPAVAGVLMLIALLAGGYAGGRTTRRGVLGGVWLGGVAWLLNLLILGSLLTASDSPNQMLPSALVWLPGSLLAFITLGALGAALGRLGGVRPAPDQEWLPRFACIAAAATLLLIIAGGLVTSAEEGLAVVDWPNSFGYNMFLYPLSRMTGGIFYEHAHRLLGSLVGLTTLVLASTVQAGRWPRWVKGTAWAALGLVLVQGLLGGLRVTGIFTLSTDPNVVMPNIYLAITHGVVGQVFFGVLIALMVFLARDWHADIARTKSPVAATDIGLSRVLPGLLVVQLVLGAILRHVFFGLQIHIMLAVIVLTLAVVTGVRAWGNYPVQPRLAKAGLVLSLAALLQLVLGLAALFATGANLGLAPTAWNLVLATAHQSTGALILALSVYLMLWLTRLLEPVPPPAS